MASSRDASAPPSGGALAAGDDARGAGAPEGPQARGGTRGAGRLPAPAFAPIRRRSGGERRMIGRRTLIGLGLGLGLALPSARDAAAQARRVVHTYPSAETLIDGRNEQFLVRFDGPIDHAGSRLEIVQAGRVVRTLTPSLRAAPEVLAASGPALPPGEYELRWSARARPGAEAVTGSIRFAIRP
jgi:methionine-rich copper-binding protein CopC